VFGVCTLHTSLNVYPSSKRVKCNRYQLWNAARNWRGGTLPPPTAEYLPRTPSQNKKISKVDHGESIVDDFNDDSTGQYLNHGLGWKNI